MSFDFPRSAEASLRDTLDQIRQDIRVLAERDRLQPELARLREVVVNTHGVDPVDPLGDGLNALPKRVEFGPESQPRERRGISFKVVLDRGLMNAETSLDLGDDPAELVVRTEPALHDGSSPDVLRITVEVRPATCGGSR